MPWKPERGVQIALIGVCGTVAAVLLEIAANAVHLHPVLRWACLVFAAVSLGAIGPIAGIRCTEPVAKFFEWCVGCIATLVGIIAAYATLIHMAASKPEWPLDKHWFVGVIMLAVSLGIVWGRKQINLRKTVRDMSFLPKHLMYIVMNGIPIPLATFLSTLGLAILWPSFIWVGTLGPA